MCDSEDYWTRRLGSLRGKRCRLKMKMASPPDQKILAGWGGLCTKEMPQSLDEGLEDSDALGCWEMGARPSRRRG